MLFNRLFRLSFVVVLALVAGMAAAAERQVLSGHVPARVQGLVTSGVLDPVTNLNLAIGLPVRDAGALSDFLLQLQDPASPNYRQYLTPEQFTERFGPTVQDYEAVATFVQSHGMTVTRRHLNRMVLSVRGAAQDIEDAFHVTLRVYPHPTEARTFYASDTEPSLDLAVPILHVSGLDDFSRPHSHARPVPVDRTGLVAPLSGSGPSGYFFGNDFRKAYIPGTALTGAGQSVGLLQFDGYYTNDITNFIAHAGITTSVILTNVPIDGGVDTPGSGNVEVSLDIEMAISMAPGLSKIIVYEAPNPSPWDDLLNQMVNDNNARQLSCSWSGGPPDATAEQIFQQMAAQGQSFFNAAGDSDAFVGDVEFPADSPNIVQVGGTWLSMTGAGNAYSSEVAWNRYNGTGTGGGISTYYALPFYQQGVSMAANHGSTILRNIPDVSLVADYIYVYYGNGTNNAFGGTSFAAPLWAGFMALANQQAAINSVPPVGFLNPALYAIGLGANYTTAFRDITSGNNFNSASPTNFPAVSGYDLCTGWGTPKGSNWINAVVSCSTLSITTTPVGVTFAGQVGGPFRPTSSSLFLTNEGNVAINWSAGTPATWLSLTPASGTLLPGGSTNVTATLTATVNNLAASTYSGLVWFTNQFNGTVQVRTFTLAVRPVIPNGDFEDGNLTGWINYGYNVVLDEATYGSTLVHAGACGLFLGTPGSLGYISQTLQTVSNRPYLLSFWLQNPYAGVPNEFLVKWGGTTLFDQTDVESFAWTNLQFVVMANATNVMLKFGARNDPYYFALDDISARLLALPAFGAMSSGTNVVTCAWSASTNVHYQPQYTTNLAPANWINLGVPILGTNDPMTATDSSPVSSQRFYRVLLQP